MNAITDYNGNVPKILPNIIGKEQKSLGEMMNTLEL